MPTESSLCGEIMTGCVLVENGWRGYAQYVNDGAVCLSEENVLVCG